MVTVDSYDLAWQFDPAVSQVKGRTTVKFRGSGRQVDLAAAQVLSASLNGRPVSWDAPLGPGTGSGGSVGGSPDVLRVEAPVAAAAGPFVRAHESVYVPRSRASVDGAAVADLMARSIACYEELLGVPYPRWRTSGPATW